MIHCSARTQISLPVVSSIPGKDQRHTSGDDFAAWSPPRGRPALWKTLAHRYKTNEISSSRSFSHFRWLANGKAPPKSATIISYQMPLRRISRHDEDGSKSAAGFAGETKAEPRFLDCLLLDKFLAP